MLWGTPPPAGGEIICASARRILRQHLKLPRLPGIQMTANSPEYCTRAGHVTGAMEDHCLEDNKLLCIPAALPDSCEFSGQRVHKAAPDSTTRGIVTPRKHECQCYSLRLPVIVVFYYPTDVQSIVEVHPFSVHLQDPPNLPCGYITGHIPCGPLAVIHRYLLICWCCFHRPHLL